MKRFSLLLHFVLLLAITVVSARDEWQTINQGAQSLVIAVNNKALYAITSSRLLQVLHDDMGFSITDGSLMHDITANKDNDIWITNTLGSIFYRSGVSSANMKGTGWIAIIGGLTGISTSRYGLVFGYNVYGQVYTRIGLSSLNHLGTSWQHIYGANVNDIACTMSVCFVKITSNLLYSTTLLQSIDSPTMTHDWINIDTNVTGIAAHGDKKLWKIDTHGVIWEAVNIFDENLLSLNWERRTYEEGRFKDVSITDKYSFAIHDDGKIYVQTGCPVFDFEDDDISEWVQTGNAFEHQPVVSQSAGNGVPGKFGERCIDTLSKRKTYTMPESASSLQGDSPTGTLLSTVFQIRTDVLHFAVGGGSYPTNYVGLMVDDSEVRQSSGKSLLRTVSGAKVRLSRYWWNATSFKGKCGQIKIHDSSSGSWGHTLFDDLRSSPPCAKGMDVSLRSNQQDDVSVGQRLVYQVDMKGFYTSRLRPLNVKVSFPVINNNSFIVIEQMNVSWTYCGRIVNASNETKLSNLNGMTHSMSVTLTNLLSDATMEIIAKVYDYNNLKIGVSETTSMTIGVDFAGEYFEVFKREIRSMRYGNETAKLLLNEKIVDMKAYLIGDNITWKVDLSHDYKESLQRASKVTIRVLVPMYMKILDVIGLEKTLGDSANILDGKVTVRIPEIQVLKNRILLIVMRLDGDSKWMRRPGRNYSGQILVDAVYYCPRKTCMNRFGNATEVVTLLKGKFYDVTFQYKVALGVDANSGFSRIRGGNGSITFICGSYGKHWKSQCFYSNATEGAWYSLSSFIQNVTYYEDGRRELYGLSRRGDKVKVKGEMFEKHEMLSVNEWSDVVARSTRFAKAENMKIGDVGSAGEKNRKYQGYCCP